MSDVPLPEPDYAQSELPRFFKDTLKQHKWWNEASMHAHAAAVSAAECAPLIEEIEALRQDGSRLSAENARLREVVESAAAADQYYDQPIAIKRLAEMARAALKGASHE